MKYFDAIKAAQAARKPATELAPFDLERLRGKGFAARFVSSLLDRPHWWLALLRRFKPILAYKDLVFLTRNADVREVLERQDVFNTPFGPEMTEMAGGTNFILGMQDSPEYRTQKSAVLSAFQYSDIETKVRPIAARHARQIMRGARPGFNAASDLLKLVPVRVCRDYFGLQIEDEVAFADWSIALSAFFFSDFLGSRTTRELAVVASDRMSTAIERSIDAHLAGKLDPDTPLGRLVATHKQDPAGLPRDSVRAIMMGMISGFVPTDLLAAGNALDVVLSKPEAQDAVEAAIIDGDDKALDAAILEAMRFKPIYLGPIRYAAKDAVIAEGTRRRREIKAGTVVWPSTLSAMFDADAVMDPMRFDPSRSPRDYLVFGYGIHWCIGSAIARTEIAESFRALFSKAGVRRARGAAGRVVRLGAYPETMRVDFEMPADCRTVENSLVTCIAPLPATADRDLLRAAIDSLGNPAGQAMQAALDRAGTIHFASISVIDPEVDEDGKSAEGAFGHLVVELSGDGTPIAVVEAFGAHAGEIVRAVLEGSGLEAGGGVSPFLVGHIAEGAPTFSRNAGLGFCGTPGHSVKRIKAEAELESDIADIIRGRKAYESDTSLAVLTDAREKLMQSGRQDWAFQPADSNLDKPGGSVGALFSSTFARPLPAIVTIAWFVFWTALNFVAVFGAWRGGFWSNVVPLAVSLGLTIVGTVLAILAIGLGLVRLLRRHERRDESRVLPVDLKRYDAITEREGHRVQNNLTAVSILKPGAIRFLAVRTGLTAVSLFARFVFKPGHLADIGTIHYARWLQIPGTKQLLFFSNYGGSWESYLEDFITKATKGLTGVWSNTNDYPKTRYLFLNGASDGDRFKRWARAQQQPTLFWYSAYPKLDTARIRINDRVRRGLAEARTEAEARSWLALFGSLPRPANVLETDQIQSIAFGPMGDLREATLLAIAIPDGLAREARKTWLAHIAKRATYGDRLPEREALVVGFGPGGLHRLGLDPDPDHDPVSTFAAPFQQGMAHPTRARILEDLGDSDPETWRWGAGDRAADAVIACYGLDRDTHDALVAEIEDATTDAGMLVVAKVPTSILGTKRNVKEHFGFADGLSQPVIAGTPRAQGVADNQHVVAAGEFLHGYADQRGYVPPSATVAIDPGGLLPRLDEAPGARPLHDFGRNGSYLVVRELRQHVDRFDDFCKRAAKDLKARLPDEVVTPDWVGAKMVGRWKDGSPLVRNPYGKPSRGAENDFTYGLEDPQGIRCPLGSHIRRSNPRDSLGPDHARQIELGKRHRILRVGRTYELPAENGREAEKGLLFMALNADIERQFEFVQQTWVASGLFHGLRFEKDPVIGTQNGGAGYTIPTVSGGVTLTGLPNFVTTRGGGYFFLPGKRSLAYMLSRL